MLGAAALAGALPDIAGAMPSSEPSDAASSPHRTTEITPSLPDVTGDEICDLSRLGRSSKWNAAERPYDDLLAALVVGARLFRQPLGQRDGRLRFDAAGRHANRRAPWGLTPFESALL